MVISQRQKIRISRAKRTRSLRQMTGLSRRSFEQATGIPAASQQNWEDIRGNGLTETGAYRMIKACAFLGVKASFDWLMHGLGHSPSAEKRVYEIDEATSSSEGAGDDIEHVGDLDCMQKELATFFNHYKEAVHFLVSDDSMLPYFNPDDWVAGERYYNQDIDSAVDCHCIVLTQSGDLMLRYVQKSDIAGYYNLLCTNYRTKAEKSFLSEVKLVSAAPVIWMRRKPPARLG